MLAPRARSGQTTPGVCAENLFRNWLLFCVSRPFEILLGQWFQGPATCAQQVLSRPTSTLRQRHGRPEPPPSNPPGSLPMLHHLDIRCGIGCHRLSRIF